MNKINFLYAFSTKNIIDSPIIKGGVKYEEKLAIKSKGYDNINLFIRHR